jgi:RNA polymerase sigma factor (TIGR02999 family)
LSADHDSDRKQRNRFVLLFAAYCADVCSTGISTDRYGASRVVLRRRCPGRIGWAAPVVGHLSWTTVARHRVSVPNLTVGPGNCARFVGRFDLDYQIEMREAVPRVRAAMESTNPTISVLIELAEQGDQVSAGKLFSVLYAELHRLAKRQLARQGDVSISATTLIHEAYLDMAGHGDQSFPDRGRFMAYASRVMRGLVIDHVRNRLAIKRGGRFELTSLTTDAEDVVRDDQELTRLSQALDELARLDHSLCQIVDLKFFCGFSLVEIADMLGVSERTVQRKWEKARLYLHRSLRTGVPL